MFENYNWLASLLKTHCAKFKALLTFSTDGEINLANEFPFELPDAIHLVRKIHMRESIERKLVKLSFDKDGRQNVLSTVFGRRKEESRIQRNARSIGN